MVEAAVEVALRLECRIQDDRVVVRRVCPDFSPRLRLERAADDVAIDRAAIVDDGVAIRAAVALRLAAHHVAIDRAAVDFDRVVVRVTPAAVAVAADGLLGRAAIDDGFVARRCRLALATDDDAGNRAVVEHCRVVRRIAESRRANEVVAVFAVRSNRAAVHHDGVALRVAIEGNCSDDVAVCRAAVHLDRAVRDIIVLTVACRSGECDVGTVLMVVSLRTTVEIGGSRFSKHRAIGNRDVIVRDARTTSLFGVITADSIISLRRDGKAVVALGF